MTHVVDLLVPDIGDFKDIPIIEVLVKVGDSIQRGDPLVTLESDKATLEVPAEVPGRISQIRIAPGDRVSKGSLLLTLEPQTGAIAAPIATATAAQPDMAPHPQRLMTPPELTLVRPTRESVSDAANRLYASPSVRRVARELAVDLTGVRGSGPRGRILKTDVQDHVRTTMGKMQAANAVADEAPATPARPTVDFSKFGSIERQPLARIRRISGVALTRNWSTIPHVTNFEEADITELERLRAELHSEAKSGPKITLVSFLVKACAAALRAFPSVNSSLDGNDVILKKYVNIGVAVDTPGGLLVPVIPNADQLGVREIAGLIAARAAEAKSGKLQPAAIEGGCFTLSSLGGIGNTGFTPIINAPEVAILGVTRAAVQPRWDGNQFVPRQILPLALSWDHRALDGAEAARFLVYIASLLQDFRRVSL
jgi:pyruvate dehydrogenase E2 component (dihydrolipoamide acetyltransferase)